MTSKEFIKSQIVKLEDDLQHYTMVDIDRVKAKYIELEIKDYKQVLQDLERLEVLERNSDKVIKDSVALMNRNIKLQKENISLNRINNLLQDRIEILTQGNEKLKKAIEIIKIKYVDTQVLINAKNLDFYNNNPNCIYALTQQEYELLNEVLSE